MSKKGAASKKKGQPHTLIQQFLKFHSTFNTCFIQGIRSIANPLLSPSLRFSLLLFTCSFTCPVQIFFFYLLFLPSLSSFSFFFMFPRFFFFFFSDKIFPFVLLYVFHFHLSRLIFCLSLSPFPISVSFSFPLSLF
jgi:hypothetical protein